MDNVLDRIRSPEEHQEGVLDRTALKEALNNLLWTYLPPWVTLGDAEKFACNIFQTIDDRWSEKPNT